MLRVAVDALELLPVEGLVALTERDAVVVAIRAGRCGRAEGSIEDLERLAKTACLRAGQARAWRVGALPPATVGEVDRGGPIREAIATTWGTRTFETREPAGNSNGSTSGWVRLEDGRVLGPKAVADLLAALAPVFGVELALGEPPPRTSRAVTLIDDGADSHSFDAEGTARQRVTIIDRGRFVRGVTDSAAGQSTGHATRALTLAPRADHLRFVPTTDTVAAPDVPALGTLRSTEARQLLAGIEAVG